MNLTEKEFDAFKAIVANAYEAMGGKCAQNLREDNFSWFDADTLMERLSINAQEAGGVMGSLQDKGLVLDYDDESGDWCITEAGIDYLEQVEKMEAQGAGEFPIG